MSSLSNVISKNPFFKDIDDDGRNEILNSMVPKPHKKGDVIIKQGDEGDNFYVIESGEVSVYVNDDHITNIKKGSSFGELALIYGNVRAATVKAKTDVKLWSLNRDVYRKILMNRHICKREMYQEFLSKISILEHLDKWDKLTIADSLEMVEYKDGEKVFKQGEPGDDFYIIFEGSALVFQNKEGHEQPVKVCQLMFGDYFGEISLLLDTPRAASVVADGPLKCVKLNKDSFFRVLGDVLDTLKKNISGYCSTALSV